MKKVYIAVITFAFLFATSLVIASELTITKIGTLAVSKRFNQWWFSGTRPTFEGIGSKGANIDITIDGVFKTIKAGADNGLWKYTPDKDLEPKDHSVIIASGDDSYSFTLTIGSDMPAPTGNSAVSELPQTGFLLPGILFGSLAVALFYFGLRENSENKG